MGSRVLASRQGVFTGAGAVVTIQEAGVDWKRVELRNITDGIIYTKTAMDKGKLATKVISDDTTQVSYGDAITINGDTITIEAAVAVATKEFVWFGMVE